MTENDRINNLCKALCIIINRVGRDFPSSEIIELQELINKTFIVDEQKGE